MKQPKLLQKVARFNLVTDGHFSYQYTS